MTYLMGFLNLTNASICFSNGSPLIGLACLVVGIGCIGTSIVCDLRR